MDTIVAQNLGKVFRWKKSEVVALREVSFSVSQGEKVGLWGPSGAGKTTLLHLLGTLERPTSGKLLLFGDEVTDKSEKELAVLRREKIGFIFQFHHLLPELTAIENVMVPLLLQDMSEDEAYDRAERILEEVFLSHRLTHRPGELSGGERQRVAVARALVTEPLLILADEPTGDLDTKTGEEVFKLLLDLSRKKGSTLIVATHNEKLLDDLDRVLELVDGKIVKDYTVA